MKKGDILKAPQGHFIEIFETDYPTRGSVGYTTLEDDEVRFTEKYTLKGYKNLGSSDSIQSTMFYLTKSIHLRLNKLNKV